MPAKKPTPKDEKPHKERFKEAARKAGDIDEEAFARAMERIARPKKSKR